MSTNFVKNFLVFVFFFNFSFLINANDKNWKYYIEKAQIEFDHKMYDFAEENLERAIEFNPDSFEAYNMLGLILINKQKYSGALDYFSKSLKIKNDQEKIHYEAAKIYEYLFDIKKSLQHFAKSLELNPKSHRAMLGVSRQYFHKGEIENSKKFFINAFNIKKKESDPILALGNQYFFQKNYNKAIEQFKQCIITNPAEINSYINISKIYRVQKNYKSALYYLEKLKFIQPYNHISYFHIANIYYSQKLISKRKKQLDLALFYIRTSIELNPSNMEAYELLYEIHKQLGNDIEAKKILKKLENF